MRLMSEHAGNAEITARCKPQNNEIGNATGHLIDGV